MHIGKLVLVLLLASPALAAETAREDAALQKGAATSRNSNTT